MTRIDLTKIQHFAVVTQWPHRCVYVAFTLDAAMDYITANPQLVLPIITRETK